MQSSWANCHTTWFKYHNTAGTDSLSTISITLRHNAQPAKIMYRHQASTELKQTADDGGRASL